MKTLITNTVPLNAGDEALLRAALFGLKNRWPDCEITVLCKDPEIARLHLPDLCLQPDLEFATNSRDLMETVHLYHETDVVLSAPGGIFNDYYPIEDRLRGLEFALDSGKPVIAFGQSIGPFWKKESLRRIGEVFGRLGAVCLRDPISFQHLTKCGLGGSCVHVTADLAFLWRRIAPDLFNPHPRPAHRIGLCFRAWPLGNQEKAQETVAKASRLCRQLLQPPESELLFLSTCQGVPGYADDSLLALKIVKSLLPELRRRCHVDRTRYTPRDLIAKLGACRAFIGMRLHGCIMALLAGTPALGLGYENKTEAIFRQLGLAPYQLSFDSESQAWLACASRFLTDLPLIQGLLPQALDPLCHLAERNFSILQTCLAQSSELTRPTCEVLTAANARTNRFLDNLHERLLWTTRIPHATRELQALIPTGASFVLVGEEQLSEPISDARRARPFLEHQGAFWGPPADDATAIRELERMRQEGAASIVFCWPAFWWFDQYPEFSSYLHQTYRCTWQSQRLIGFDLTLAPPSHPAQHVQANGTEEVDLIRQVIDKKLTYLNYAALADLQTCVATLARRQLHGIIIEAGCAAGGSALVIAAAKAKKTPFRVYDVFGMIPPPSPEEDREVKQRYDLIQSGQARGIGNKTYYGYETNLFQQVAATFSQYHLDLHDHSIQLVKGPFEETLGITEPVALAHLDCDWYHSVRTCLERIEPLLVRGGRFIVDDYFRWPGCRRAVDGYFADKSLHYRFEMRSRLHIVRR